MSKYRVTETSFINNALHKEGDTVDYDGIAGKNLESLEAEAPAVDTSASASDAARMTLAARGGLDESGNGTPSALDAARMNYAAKGGNLGTPPPATTAAFEAAAAVDAATSALV